MTEFQSKIQDFFTNSISRKILPLDSDKVTKQANKMAPKIGDFFRNFKRLLRGLAAIFHEIFPSGDTNEGRKKLALKISHNFAPKFHVKNLQHSKANDLTKNCEFLDFFLRENN